MLIGILGGLFIKQIIAKFGRPFWIWTHRFTVISYILVYIHSWKIGSDFNNWIFHLIFQALFFIIVIGYVIKIRKSISARKNERIIITASQVFGNVDEPWFLARKSFFSNKPGIALIPIKWEGVVTYLVFSGLAVFLFFYFEVSKMRLANWMYFFISLLVLLVFFIVISKNTSRRG